MSNIYSNSPRQEGVINLNALGLTAEQRIAVVAAVIGTSGSNIKRLTTNYRGLYVRLHNAEKGPAVDVDGSECDTIYISGRTAADVTGTAGLINQDIQATVDSSKKSSRPTIKVPCPSEAAGTVIGTKGFAIKYIQSLVDEGCYIVHDRPTNSFTIVANKQTAVDHAKIKIEEAIEKYFADQKAWEKQKRARGRGQVESASSASSNSYACLSLSDDDSDSDDSSEDERDEIRRNANEKRLREVRLKRDMFDCSSSGSSGSSSIADKKGSTRERWAIRKALSKEKDPTTGGPLFADYQSRDFKTGRNRSFTGVHAVPWDAVDAEQKRIAGEQTLRREQSDARTRKGEMDMRRRKLTSDTWDQCGSGGTTVVHGWGGDSMGDVKSSTGAEELSEKTRAQSYADERRDRVKADKDRKEKSSGNMVRLGKCRNKRFTAPATKSSTVDLSKVIQAVSGGEAEETVIDVSPNITLDVKDKPADRDEAGGTFVGWGDVLSVDEGEWSPPVRGQEDNSAW